MARLGHLAVWAGLYVAGASAFLIGFAAPPASARPRILLALFVAFLTGMATYLFDRVKLADERLDPADRASNPERYLFLASRAPALRLACALLAATAAFLGDRLDSLVPPLVLASLTGVFLYGGRPRAFRGTARCSRPKDLFLLKNAAIATSITAFACALDHLARLAPPAASSAPLLGALFLLVFSDSVLCDIEDREADRSFRTDTVPALHGEESAWLAAGLAQVGFTVLLFAYDTGPLAVLWVVSTTLSFLALAVLRPKALRDFVDARLAVLAVLAWLLVG
ncbi:MAG TPA: hypothetical protein ENJ09_10570 [Planctomycetes bacterium]|nr:hypothetical protein [Planctomycetota bacterium]